MGRSSSKRWLEGLDRAALVGLTVGLALYVMPVWREGRLRPAFWITLLSTLLHVFTSHARSSNAPPAPAAAADPMEGGRA